MTEIFRSNGLLRFENLKDTNVFNNLYILFLSFVFVKHGCQAIQKKLMFLETLALSKSCEMLIFLVLSILAHYLTEATTQSQAIYNKLFVHQEYNKYLRPVKNASSKQTIKIDAGLYSIDQISELTETMTLTNWLKLKWKDEFLIWNPSEYSGVTSISVPASIVWIPDIVVLGLQDMIWSLSEEKTIGIVYSDGRVRMTFLQVNKMHCNYNINLFPFDVQNCTLQYGSWEFDGTKIDIDPIENGFGIKHFQHNAEWELVSYTPMRKETIINEDERYVEMHYYLVIKRRPVYYIFALVVPSFVITMLAMVGLFSPFNSYGERQEKVTMGLTTLLTMSVLLLIVAEQMPKTSKMGLPLLGTFILWEIIIASTATCVTVGLMYLHRRGIEGSNPPAWILKVTFLANSKVRTESEKKEFAPLPQDKDIYGSTDDSNRLQSRSSGTTIDVKPKEERLSRVSNKSSKPIFGLGAARAKSTTRAATWRKYSKLPRNSSTDSRKNLYNDYKKEAGRHIDHISHFVNQRQYNDAKTELWRKVTDRIDIFMMIFFLLLNLIVSIIMLLVIGLSNQ